MLTVQQQYWAELTDLTYPPETPRDHQEALEEEVEVILWEVTPLEGDPLEEGEILQLPTLFSDPKKLNWEGRNQLSLMVIEPNPKNSLENGPYTVHQSELI